MTSDARWNLRVYLRFAARQRASSVAARSSSAFASSRRAISRARPNAASMSAALGSRRDEQLAAEPLQLGLQVSGPRSLCADQGIGDRVEALHRLAHGEVRRASRERKYVFRSACPVSSNAG